MTLPEQGLAAEQIRESLSQFRQDDLSWRDGRVLAYVYDAGPEAEAVVKEAFTQYLSENALDPTTFPSTMQMEREIVRITAALLRGDDQVVGNVTTGGTESIMLAVKTARDWARAKRPSISQPEIILSRTAHAAFHKAAHYLDLKLVIVPFDKESYRTDADAMHDAITDNTILLVASAPNYSHGVVDHIPEIAALAQEHDLLFHVDACIGGFQLAFMRQIGYDVPPFDFTVPGVTSISADLHKYGYAAKGASILLHRNKALRRYQIYANLSTTAYAIINPTVLSTKSGGPLAAGWAILHYLGLEGYQRIVRQVTETTKKMIAGINALPDLHVLGQPDMCIFALESETINVFQLADVMKDEGWLLQPQFSKTASLQPNIHITVNQSTVGHAKAFLSDLAQAVEETKALPPLNVSVVKEQVDSLLDSMPLEEVASAFYQLAGIEGSQLPGDMAFINTVLSVLPPPIAEEMLLQYINDLYT
jgi:glutamate/tyrosine decarboxylase-like PLP-dependent enzyme